MLGYLTTSDHQLYRVSPLKTSFGLLTGFITISTTRNYNHLRRVTFTQLTILHVNIPFLTSSHTHFKYNLQFTRWIYFTYELSVTVSYRELLVELLLKNGLIRHSSSSYKTLNRTSVTVAWKEYLPICIAAMSQVRGMLRHSRKREGHVIFPYSWCRVTSPWHVA
jgi:hypothetical protein